MNSQLQSDYSIQSILYRPNIDQNLKMDKKYMRKKRQIFQSLSLRKKKKGELPTDERSDNNETSLISLLQADKPQQQKLHLPNIYLYSKPKHKEIIPIEQTNKIIKEMSKSLNFINKKISVLNFDFFGLFKEDTKSLPYQSPLYKKELGLLNLIFGQCGIVLKPRDVLVLEGEKSKTRYAIFTNHPKHPQSLCCESQILIKHIQFITIKNFRFTKQKSFQLPFRSIIILSCMKCNDQILKIKPSQQTSDDILLSPRENSDFQEQKRLMNFSKLISSGRFKKTLISDKSVELMKSRNLTSLDRSKTGLSKLEQISSSHKVVKDSRYDRCDRQVRIKSYQQSLNLKQKVKQNSIERVLLNSLKRKANNFSEIKFRKDVEL